MITRNVRDGMKNNLKYGDNADNQLTDDYTWSAIASHQQFPSLRVGLRSLSGRPEDVM